jgi:hypothetical protein
MHGLQSLSFIFIRVSMNHLLPEQLAAARYGRHDANEGEFDVCTINNESAAG